MSIIAAIDSQDTTNTTQESGSDFRQAEAQLVKPGVGVEEPLV